jgi:hypothetical protein
MRLDSDEWYRSTPAELAQWRKYAKNEETLAPILAAHPEKATRQALLEQVVADAKSYQLGTRDMAARFLRLDTTDGLSAEDRKLLYDTGPVEALAELTKRLGDADLAKRTAAMALLRQAPDEVLVALEGTLAKSIEPQARAQGEELVRQAKARLELVATTPRGLAP